MSRTLTTKESLMNYAAWYAMRYLPSSNRLREALMKKTLKNDILVDSVMTEMIQYISEDRTVDGLVRMYIDQRKTRPYIEKKLCLKKFNPDIISTTLDVYSHSFTSWITYEHIIERKIHEYNSKNKSKSYIYWMLVQRYPLFKNDIKILLDETIPSEWEMIRWEYLKLCQRYDKTDKKEQQKIRQKLYTKWFPFDLIRKIIQDKD